MYVVGVGLVKVYKALLRLERSTLCPFLYFSKTATQKLLSDKAWSLVQS